MFTRRKPAAEGRIVNMRIEQNPFALTPLEIEALTEDEFVTLLNRLIEDRAIVAGVRIENVRTTLRTNDPDGGIDAAVDTATVDDQFLGQGYSVWQFKKSFPSDTTRTQAESDL